MFSAKVLKSGVSGRITSLFGLWPQYSPNPACYQLVNATLFRTLKSTSQNCLSANQPDQSKKVSFATLFRNSPLVQLGLPEGKIVCGTVVDVVGDDLYIDFGFKFNAVCRKPKQNSQKFVRGALVKVQINDLEMSDRFLGSPQDMTLLEADVTLLGLISSPVNEPDEPTRS